MAAPQAGAEQGLAAGRPERDPDRRPRTHSGYPPAIIVCDACGGLCATDVPASDAHTGLHTTLLTLQLQLEQLAARVAAIQAPDATPGAGAASPQAGAAPGPGERGTAAATAPATPPPPAGEDDSAQPAPREAATAGTGQPEPSIPAHPPGVPEQGPVVAACLAAGLPLGTARLYLATQLPALFGKEHGQHPLATIAELATIPGTPGDRRSLCWAALDGLRRQFKGMAWPDLPRGD